MAEGDNYTDVILEDIQAKMQAVLEITHDTSTKVDRISERVDGLPANVAELKSDMKIVKQAVTDTNKDLLLLERRVAKLEKTA